MQQFRADFQRTPNSNSINSPTHTYIDIDINNNNLSVMAPIPLVYNQTKNTNIINDCSQYHLSVIRWNSDSIIPVIIPEMLTGGVNNAYDGRTVYKMQFGIGPNVDTIAPIGSPKTIIFQPDINYLEINSIKPVNRPSTMVDVYSNQYFYLHSVKSFLAMVNLALVDLVIAAKASPYAQYFKSQLYPQFIWDTALNKISLYIPIDYIQPATGSTSNTTLYIGMNPELYYLFNTYPVLTPSNLSSINSNTALNYVFRLEDELGLNGVLLSDGATYYKYTQEQSSVGGWSPCSSIVFSSYTIPVNTTGSGVPDFFGPNPYNSNAINNVSNSITDFEIPLDNGLELSNTVLYYSPQSEYRLFDINSNEPLSKLQISVYWKTKYGTYNPFLLKHAGTASLKLMFRKKDFQTSYI